MAKPKPSLAGVLDDLPTAPPAVRAAPQATSRRRRAPKAKVETTEQEETVLVGANLPPKYARNLAMLHAETGKTKKELVQEALDLLFLSKAGPALKN